MNAWIKRYRLIKNITRIFSTGLPKKIPSHLRFTYDASTTNLKTKIKDRERIILEPGKISIETLKENFHFEGAIFKANEINRTYVAFPLLKNEFAEFYKLLRKYRFDEIGLPTCHNSLHKYETSFYETVSLEIFKVKDGEVVKEYSTFNSMELSLEGKNLERFTVPVEYLIKLKNSLNYNL